MPAHPYKRRRTRHRRIRPLSSGHEPKTDASQARGLSDHVLLHELRHGIRIAAYGYHKAQVALFGQALKFGKEVAQGGYIGIDQLDHLDELMQNYALYESIVSESGMKNGFVDSLINSVRNLPHEK